MTALHTSLDVAILTSPWGFHNRASYYSSDWEILSMSNLASSIPGTYPLGYIAEHLHLNCRCGKSTETLTLFTIERGNAPNQKPFLRRTGLSETIYALSISHREVHGGTAACLSCVSTLALEPVPNYDNRKNLRSQLGTLGPTMTRHLGMDEKKPEPAKTTKFKSILDLNV